MSLFVVQHGVHTTLVNAQSWYRAREWGRATYGDSLRCVIATGPTGDVPIEVPPAMTCTEIAREHGESLRAAGRREALIEALDLFRETSDDAKYETELRRRAGA